MGRAESRRQLYLGIAQIVFRPHFRLELRPSRNWPLSGPSVCRLAAAGRLDHLYPGTSGEFRGQRTHQWDAGVETVEYSLHLAESTVDRGKRPASPSLLATTNHFTQGLHSLACPTQRFD